MYNIYNPVGGVVPQNIITISQEEIKRQLDHLYGELIAAGCEVTPVFDSLEIRVPHGRNIDGILERHSHIFKGGV